MRLAAKIEDPRAAQRLSECPGRTRCSLAAPGLRGWGCRGAPPHVSPSLCSHRDAPTAPVGEILFLTSLLLSAWKFLLSGICCLSQHRRRDKSQLHAKCDQAMDVQKQDSSELPDGLRSASCLSSPSACGIRSLSSLRCEEQSALLGSNPPRNSIAPRALQTRKRFALLQSANPA